jgi:hypothetical protein
MREVPYDGFLETYYKLPQYGAEVFVSTKKSQKSYWTISLLKPKIQGTDIVGFDIAPLPKNPCCFIVRSGRFKDAVFGNFDEQINVYSHQAAKEEGFFER